MEVARAGKWLPDDARADDLAIPRDELSVGLVGKDQLRQPGDHQRIDDPQQNRRHDGHQHCDNQDSSS